MDFWDFEERDGGIVVASYTNAPMNYFVAEGAAELGALTQPGAIPPTSTTANTPWSRISATSSSRSFRGTIV